MVNNLPKQSNDNNSDFIVGDAVVLTEACRNFHSDDLFEIQCKSTNALWVIRSKNHLILAANNEIRPATVAEIKAKRRLPAPALLFVSLDEPDREQFEKSHPHLDLHYVYALGEYSDANTQHQWSSWQQLSIGADQYIENHISPRCKNISCDEAVHLANAFRSIREV